MNSKLVCSRPALGQGSRHRLLKAAGLCAFLLGTLAYASAAGIDWYRWRGPDLNGLSAETGWSVQWPKEGPKPLWKASVGTGFSSVVVSKGRGFTMGNTAEQDTVFCFKADTGGMLWKHSYPCPLDPKYYEGGPGSTPTVDGDRVFTLSKRGHVFCFEADSGHIVWQKNLMEELGVAKPEWGFAGSPLVEQNLLVLNVGTAGTALDKRTGKLVWTSGTNAAGYASPVPCAMGDERAGLIFSGKALYAVNLSNGQEFWRLPWVTKWDINAADPIVRGQTLLVSTFDQGAALIEALPTLGDFHGAKGPGQPKELWRSKSMGNHFNPCVIVDGYIYGFDGNTDKPNPELRCLYTKNGEVRWSQAGLGLGSLMAADGKLIILSEKGELIIAEAKPAAFRPLARAQVLGGKCWSMPVLSQGRIYCRNAKGDLVCLDVKGEKPE